MRMNALCKLIMKTNKHLNNNNKNIKKNKFILDNNNQQMTNKSRVKNNSIKVLILIEIIR